MMLKIIFDFCIVKQLRYGGITLAARTLVLFQKQAP